MTNQWRDFADTGSPPISRVVNERNGHWSLMVDKQSAPGVHIRGGTYRIFDVPLGTSWHDVKMEIKFSKSDAVGYVRLWHNGIRQKFIDGSDTYYVRTLIPGGGGGAYYKDGYYRKPMAPTGIVYHAGFRTAASQAAL